MKAECAHEKATGDFRPVASFFGLAIDRLRSDRFDHLVQTALGAIGRVLMQQVLGCGLVDFLLSNTKLGLSGRCVASFDGVTDAAKLAAKRASFGAVRDAEFFVLAETLLRTIGIWHVKGTRRRRRLIEVKRIS